HDALPISVGGGPGADRGRGGAGGGLDRPGGSPVGRERVELGCGRSRRRSRPPGERAGRHGLGGGGSGLAPAEREGAGGVVGPDPGGRTRRTEAGGERRRGVARRGGGGGDRLERSAGG